MTALRHLSVVLALALSASPAFAAEGATGPSPLMNFLLPIGLLVIFYFLLIRPQQRRQKQHREMVEGVKKGDTVVTNGGLIGKVVKPGEKELTVEIAEGVRVRLVRGMIADVRGKGEPVAANDTQPS